MFINSCNSTLKKKNKQNFSYKLVFRLILVSPQPYCSIKKIQAQPYEHFYDRFYTKICDTLIDIDLSRHQTIMSKFLGLFKKQKRSESRRKVKDSCSSKKVNIVNVFNQETEIKISMFNCNLDYNESEKRVEDFSSILTSPVVSIEQLQAHSWNGIPSKYRSLSWKILLRYCPTNKQTRVNSLAKKRSDYFSMVDTYIEKPTLEKDAQERKTYKLINDDVLRTLPQTKLFRNETIQKILRRVLYIWHMRHPSSGYVQGINDVVTPFIVVYLNEHIQINYRTMQVPEGFQNLPTQIFEEIQADTYWCLCKILDCILDNYTASWPGIQKSFNRMKQVIKRVDPELLDHFSKQGIDFYHMYFKWVTCLLLRQFSVKIGLRLFDTYLSDQHNYFDFSLYILAAIILKYSKKFKKMKFEEMMAFQQNMPTRLWTEEDLCTVIAEAYVYQSYFNK